MFKVHKKENKSTDWKLLSITNAAGDLVEEVSANRIGKDGTVFPDFDDIDVGSTLEGKLWQSPKGKWYLFPPKDSPKKDSSPAARESSGGLAEVANILKLQILPKIETIRKDQIAILGKLGMMDKEDHGFQDVKGF